ncbi:uncharacterized protein KGF55_005533 [Candida pseudojiufengensis]|uniref:uncharacterized protein n=1 Tax=Candida pseudojiufengensis TaxID=497109 RepID=UPI0022257C35|nr:uncharacterized protein KGF55_005533 [Candida pseudojiufengensis]KAI5959190.1 hypothetical protein KGF55_005533 [Candida pseudojiufengensis]
MNTNSNQEGLENLSLNEFHQWCVENPGVVPDAVLKYRANQEVLYLHFLARSGSTYAAAVDARKSNLTKAPVQSIIEAWSNKTEEIDALPRLSEAELLQLREIIESHNDSVEMIERFRAARTALDKDIFLLMFSYATLDTPFNITIRVRDR